MASLLSPRRSDPDLELRASVADRDRPSAGDDESAVPRTGWLAVAAGGALLVALAGWVVVTGLATLGWLASDAASLGGAVAVGTQLWLLAHGAGARLGSTALTLVPWGATLVFALLLCRVAGYAGRQARRAGGPRPGVDAALVTGAVAIAYTVPVVVVALLGSGLRSALHGLLVTAVVAALAAGRGSCRALGYRPTDRWPAWARAVPRATLAAQLTLLAAGTLALGAAVAVHLDRVLQLASALHAGVLGGIALWLVQLAFVPDAVVWAASWTLGAGFTVGQGTVVAPAASTLGLLPSVPLFGALPGTGPGRAGDLWWLAAGVLAGGVAAWVVVRARPGARPDLTSLVGGLAGVLAGLVFVGVAWACTGDLGVQRLTGLGPRLAPLAVVAPVTLGLSGMIVGLLLGLAHRVRRRRSPDADVAG